MSNDFVIPSIQIFLSLKLSWVRKRDWHILSHGRKIFTSDDRFTLIQDENPHPNKITESNNQKSKKPKNYFFSNQNHNNKIR